MSFNKQYNTRFTGRYNTLGQFVSGGETFSQSPNARTTNNLQPIPSLVAGKLLCAHEALKRLRNQPKEEDDSTMDQEPMNQSVQSDEGPTRPYWMKSKLSGVKKISNKERRRRQNENLRRLLTPKNALMVLNEMMPNEQVTNQFKVEAAQLNAFKANNTHSFCADLTIEGNVYKGYGDNKLMARNAAAEQAIRDLIIKKMNRTVNSDSGSTNGAEMVDVEETLPMIQLASFALHKLFTEWEYDGHSVPQLKPNNTPHVSTSEPAAESAVSAAPPKPKALPAHASSLHPCMLLTNMRPNLEYREVATPAPGPTDRQQKPGFTMSVEVDGVTFIGKGSNKKEARKMAAKAACAAIFNVTFDENITQ